MPPSPPRANDETRYAIAIIEAKLANVQSDIAEMKAIVRGEYIRREEFSPVKQVVFGLVAVIMLAVVGAMVTLVLRQ